MSTTLDKLNDKLKKGAWKEVMRNGVKYYASGPHTGKVVGSIRGNKAPKTNPKKPAKEQDLEQPQINKKPDQAAEVNQQKVESTKVPERSGSKTENIDAIIGSYSGKGKVSKVEYRSPVSSTCNLVGYVAFGKTSVENQKILNEKLQQAEILLTDLGIKFKTPLDFICQKITDAKHGTQASYFPSAKSNPKVQINKSGSGLQKSLMHEIGHAIDYAMAERGVTSANRSKEAKTLDTQFGSDLKMDADVKKEFDALADLVSNSDFYRDTSSSKYRQYLNAPTEIFARAFEVYAYVKGEELVKKGKLDKSYLENYEPDIFKTKNKKLSEIYKEKRKVTNLLYSLPPGHEKIIELAERNKELLQQIDKLSDKNEWLDIEPNKRKEYSEKIVKHLDTIFKKDSIKKAMKNLIFKLQKGSNKTLFYVSVVPIDPFGQVLLGLRKEDGIWTIPGGGAEPGESPEQAASREAFEEAGLVIRPEELQLLNVKSAPNGKPVHCFLYRVPSSGSPLTTTRLDPDREVESWNWYSKFQLPKGLSRQKNQNRLETINQAFMKFFGISKSEAFRSLIDKLNKGKNIVTPAKEMVEEHENLIEVLESPSHKDDKKEAKKQTKELKEYKKEMKKGGPGSGQKGHKTLKQEFGGAKNNPAHPYDEAANAGRKLRNSGEEVGDDKNRKPKQYTTTGSSTQQAHEKRQAQKYRKEAKASTRTLSIEEYNAIKEKEKQREQELKDKKERESKMKKSNLLSLLEKLNKGGPGSGIKGHKTPIKEKDMPNFDRPRPAYNSDVNKEYESDSSEKKRKIDAIIAMKGKVAEGPSYKKFLEDMSPERFKVFYETTKREASPRDRLNARLAEKGIPKEKRHLYSDKKYRGETSIGVDALGNQLRPGEESKRAYAGQPQTRDSIAQEKRRQELKMKKSNVISLTEKLNKGGPGSGQRGHHTARPEGQPRPQGQAPEQTPQNKLQAHLRALKEGGVIPGIQTKSGKPLVTDPKAADALGYTVQDHVDAMNAHHQLAVKTSAMIDKLKMAGRKVPPEAKQIVDFHQKKMREQMNSRDILEERHNKTAVATAKKKEAAVASVKKSVTQMGGGLGDRDINLGEYAQARSLADQEWLEKIYNGMDNYGYGDVPRSFETQKGTLHLSKVDDGLYSGYFTNREIVENGELQDNARVRIERMTIPELVQFMMAKEWVSPVIENGSENQVEPEQKNFNEGGLPAMFSETAEEPKEMIEELNSSLDSTLVAPIDKKIKLLELISKLMS